ncbi:hypothetical protein K505DRAFT_360844 [Melanomma pulvis-pyrius CBS 109.77]|uniref:VOC domain-containing protein n=1 Tax=Melanomma pulvis-pyrius CBS 109.77 TaxID=1314802 RepID=A0A6A6XEG7_9PLEO|nr:hypothetical protein K505DRAFT_360844 [Melanomma pulvis-pyrius CBS 109.77]
MLDHAAIKTTPELFRETVEFYEKALEPLGYKKMREIPDKAAGFGEQTPDFWIFVTGDQVQSAHVALRAKDRATVRTFYEAAITAGGKDNGEPGLRTQIHENFYASFVHDPAGNNIEAVCHSAE